MKGPPSVKGGKKKKRYNIKTHNKMKVYKWEYQEALEDMGVQFSDSASYGELERLYKKEYKNRLKRI